VLISSSSALTAEVLFLRKQLAWYEQTFPDDSDDPLNLSCWTLVLDRVDQLHDAVAKGPTMSNTRLNDILLKVVRPLLDLAYARDDLDKNPHDWMQKRRQEHPDDIDPFSFEEMLALLEALPAGKMLMPGVIAHATDLVEHPELVAERLVNYAQRVGRENVQAGTDCGSGSRVGHEEVVWAKLKALAEGACIASQKLWPR
jgi:hypothetical protein